jgi:hypothetical protein
MLGMRRRLLLIVLCLIVFVNFGNSQSYMVKPMFFELEAAPGNTANFNIELRNTQANGNDAELLISFVDLMQTPEDGNITIKEEKNKVLSYSCLSWLKADRDTVMIPSLQVVRLSISANIPQNARGFYCAALLVSTRPPVNPIGVVTVFRFLVPVFINIKGPALPKKLEILDTGIKNKPLSKVQSPEGKVIEKPSREAVVIKISNSGMAMTRFGGELFVFAKLNEKWIQFTELDIPQKRILPGSIINLNYDLPRRLPTSDYRLDFRGTIDGKPMKLFSKEIHYKNDENVDALLADADFTVNPKVLSLDGTPKSARTTSIVLKNNSAEDLTFELKSSQTASLKGVAVGEVTGDVYSCHEWIKIKTETVTLKKNAQKNIPVVVEFPEQSSKNPFFYSTIGIKAIYPDGQNAGLEKIQVILNNKKVEPLYRLTGQNVSLTKGENETYDVVAKFANTGNVHLTPTCEGNVTDNTGLKSFKSFEMKCSDEMILPLNVPQFYGSLDFAGLEDGYYIVQITANYNENKKEILTLPIKISKQDDKQIVETVEAAKNPSQ